jgi:hypothetical protein
MGEEKEFAKSPATTLSQLEHELKKVQLLLEEIKKKVESIEQKISNNQLK